MAYQSKRALISLITSLLVFFYMFSSLLGKIDSTGQMSPEAFTLWGRFFFQLILVQVVAKVIVFVIFNIINAIITRESEPEITDERDRLIELKAVRNLSMVFGAGFFLAMGAVAFGQPLHTMFLIFAITMAINGLVLDGSYILHYQRGY